MNETLFVSDIHLDPKRSTIVDLFNHFLLKRALHADAVYILGDLFEYWIGDDAPYSEYTSTFNALKEVCDTGTPVYFMHGNRDFLIAKKFSEKTGVTLLPEEKVIDLYDDKVLLLHGDTLCIDDVKYQEFRKKTHNKFYQWIVLHLPISTRQKLANYLRNTSKQEIAEKTLEIMDANQSAVEMAFKKHHVTTLIHGHTHRPNIHKFSKDNTDYTRVVLGDWYQQGSVLVVTPDNMALESFSSI
ncbi:MAG: UDP-2,3-diacylglucosamine diphosphatase [Pseudomonadota bacterium]